MNIKNAFILLLLTALCSLDTMAYLDPGTGSYIIQMLIAGAIGGAYAIKLYWQRIVFFFRGKSKAEEDFLEETEDE